MSGLIKNVGKRVTKSFCIVWSIKAAMRADNEAKLSAYSGHDLKTINRQIMLAYNAGMKVVPSCDNHDELGHCKGHDK